jgi:hypothetical protein
MCKHATDPNVTSGCEVTKLQNKENYYNTKLQHWTSYEAFKCYITSIQYSDKQDYESFLNNRNSSKELMDYVLNSLLHAISSANQAFLFLRHAKPHSKLLKILISPLYALF